MSARGRRWIEMMEWNPVNPSSLRYNRLAGRADGFFFRNGIRKIRLVCDIIECQVAQMDFPLGMESGKSV